MGTYTNTLKLYKTASDEVVDVEQQLNYNWDILDKQVKRLLEYEYSTAPAPNVVGALNRSRFYKEYSNSFMAYFSAGNFFYQDPTAFVSPWVDATALFTGGTEINNSGDPAAYRIIKKSGGTTTEIEWTGSFWQNGGTMDLNSNITGVMTLPVAIRPVVNKYFTCYAGNTATQYSFARVLFATSGDVEYIRYGTSDQLTPGDNRIDLSGIKYNLEVAA